MHSGQAELGMAVFASMRRSRVSAYPGWLTITNQLFAVGQLELAEQCVKNRKSDWMPDSDMYEHLIKSVFLAPQDKDFMYKATSDTAAEEIDTTEEGASEVQQAYSILEEMQVSAELTRPGSVPALQIS